jgi:multidrug efflux system membrane fusion protein
MWNPIMVQWSVLSPSWKSRRLLIGGLAGVAALAVIAGISSKYAFEADANAAPAAPAAIPVNVNVLAPRTVDPFAEFSGRISSVDYAEIRPQVTGRITEIHFRDGQHVNAGDILFVIDPRPYQAAVDKAEADLATATNNAKFAKAERDRGAQLIKSYTLSQETYDQRVNADDVGQAAVRSAQASLEAAQVNLDNAYIKAPISGRMSRAEITLGNLVGSPTAPPPLLASIVSDNGVYADFDIDEQAYLTIVRNYGQTPADHKKVPVEVVIAGDSGHVYRGNIDSFDNRISTATGTIRSRARFANEDGSLIPGMFVSVRMGAGSLPAALVVPESAIGNDQSKRFVFVVGDDNKAQYRTVSLGPQVDGARVITAGVQAGERVILDHLQRLTPGALVAPADRRTASN